MNDAPWVMIAMAALLLSGCVSQPKVRVTDLAPARLPPGERIVVDGKADEAVWRQAAVMPFEKTGKAMFLWDDSHLYGVVYKYEARFLFDEDEQICVRVRDGKRTAALFFEENLGTRDAAPSFVLREAWCDGWLSGDGRTALHGDQLTTGTSYTGCKRGFAWTAEFSLRWAPLAKTAPSGDATSVLVYRLMPKRPFTHAATMTTEGGKPEAQ